MKKSHNFFISVGIFLIIFGFFSWEKMYKNVAIFFGFDLKIPENQYNQALKLSEKGDFSGTLDILPSEMEYFPERLPELRGDLLYMQKADSGAIISEYEKSLSLMESVRIREKIRLIQNEISDNSQKNPEKSEETTEEIQKLEEQILGDQEHRSDYIDPYNSSLESLRKDIQNMKNILESNDFSEQKDW